MPIVLKKEDTNRTIKGFCAYPIWWPHKLQKHKILKANTLPLAPQVLTSSYTTEESHLVSQLPHIQPWRWEMPSCSSSGSHDPRHPCPSEPKPASRSSMDLMPRFLPVRLKALQMRLCVARSTTGRRSRNTRLGMLCSSLSLAQSYSSSLGMSHMTANLDCQLDYI